MNTTNNMHTIRVIWQDRFYGAICMYRGFVIKENEEGWITDIPGEKETHESEEAAKMAIDEAIEMSMDFV